MADRPTKHGRNVAPRKYIAQTQPQSPCRNYPHGYKYWESRINLHPRPDHLSNLEKTQKGSDRTVVCHVVHVFQVARSIYFGLQVGLEFPDPSTVPKGRVSGRIRCVTEDVRVFPVSDPVYCIGLQNRSRKVAERMKGAKTPLFLSDAQVGIVNATRQLFAVALFSAEIVVVTKQSIQSTVDCFNCFKNVLIKTCVPACRILFFNT